MATPQMPKEAQDLVRRYFGFLTDDHGFEITSFRQDRGWFEVIFQSPNLTVLCYYYYYNATWAQGNRSRIQAWAALRL